MIYYFNTGFVASLILLEMFNLQLNLNLKENFEEEDINHPYRLRLVPSLSFYLCLHSGPGLHGLALSKPRLNIVFFYVFFLF